MRFFLLLGLLSACGGDTAVTKVARDADGDGYDEDVDCDDAHRTVNPDAPEVCDGLDNDCDETVDEDPDDGVVFYADADGDGSGDAGSTVVACEAPDGFVDTSGDCDDADASAFPGNVEVCDGVDDDCDGLVDGDDATDPVTVYADADGDGYGDAADAVTACDPPAGFVQDGTDCDDADARVHPDAEEPDCTDPKDYNCDGSTGYADADGDGSPACEDCDDADAARSPSAPEVCDEADVDEDCSGAADDDDPGVTGASTWYRDYDADGYASGSGATLAQCEAPAGYASATGDCDDYDPGVHPGAAEVCDARDTDEDCSGAADDADAGVDPATWSTWYRDADADAYGDAAVSVASCDAPADFVADATDCDDAAAHVHPGATEACDGDDDDCDGATDEADAVDASTWYADVDGDGYGGDATTTACDAPAGYVSNTADCDDGVAAISPAATEVCDAADTDEDCDGLADDADPAPSGRTSWYRDGDGDGYGSTTSAAACDRPSGYADVATDCDDAAAGVSPGATEVCDAADVDEDCDGLADDADASVTGTTPRFTDADGDGYGAGASVASCDGAGAANDDDCDDGDAGVSPAATEVCDAADVDEDCDGLADDADPSVSGGTALYADADGDGYGAGSATTTCAGTGVANAEDCDDTDPDVSPAGTETCGDGVENVCDGVDFACMGAGDYGETDAFARIRETTAGRMLAADLAAVGDVNGDGADDIFLVDESWDTAASNVGAGLLFLGPLSGDYTVADADATLTGPDASDALDNTTFAGDLDGDGQDDLAVCGESADPSGYANEGGCWGVYGPTSGTTSLATPDWEVYGGATNRYMRALAGVGDLDGDGADDLAIGTWGSGSATANDLGIFYGPLSGSAALTSADVTLTGEASDDGIGSVAGHTDLDGDGLLDLVVGAPINDGGAYGSGAVYVLYGPVTGGVGGYDRRYTGNTSNDWLGYGVSTPGDLDGDGYGELLGSAFFGGYQALVYGPPPASGTMASVADAVFTTSDLAPDQVGRGAGDLDGDGDDELVLGDHNASLSGSYRGVVGVFDAPLGSLDPTDATLRYTGDTDSDAMQHGDGAGDMDGDGMPDVMVSVILDDAGGTNAGAVWLFSPR